MKADYNFWHITSDGVKLFNRFKWIDFLKDSIMDVESKYAIKLDIVAPWGFELLNDVTYLTRNIRRFFCYVAITRSNPDFCLTYEALSKEIGSIILNNLKIIDLEFYNKFAILMINESPILLRDAEEFSHSLNNCMLSILIRNANDILLEYSKYIIGTIAGVLNNSGEPTNYMFDILARWRLFQLYIMHEELFGDLIPTDNLLIQKSKQDISKLIGNYVGLLYNRQSNLPVMASLIESDLINNVIIPRLKLIKNAITLGRGPLINDQVLCFHSNDQLSISISADIYEAALKRIRFTYQHFAEEVLNYAKSDQS